MKQEIIIIGGPTASGKSAEAIRLAEEHNGEIINADSMQMYSMLHILTARPSDADLQCAPHHLYGVLGPQDWGSVAAWYEQAIACIQEIWRRGRLPIVVGGTGLYLKALTDGLSPIPEIPDAIRESVRESAGNLSKEDFYKRVSDADPEIIGSLRPSDTQRLSRAWEVKLATGQSIRSFQGKAERLLDLSYTFQVLLPDRLDLNKRIDARAVQMVEEGAIDEVTNLMQAGLPLDHPLMKAVGVPEIMAHLRGEIDFATAIALIQQTTRQFAKRQYTWFRRYGG